MSTTTTTPQPTPPSTTTPASTTPTSPLQQLVLKKSDLDDPSLSLLNQILTNQNQLINYLLGHAGEITLNNHLNLAGKRITNVGAAISPTDVVNHAFANANYGAPAIKPLMESLGKNGMQSYRRLSDQNQREKHSSFLNLVSNTAPTANTSTVIFGAAGGGTVPVTITAGFHQRVDGSVVPYASRNDTLSLPTAIAITSLTRASNIVTAVTSTPDGLAVGDGFSVVGTSDHTFDGTFSVLTVSPPDTSTYFQGGPNASSSGGSISVGGIYYYTLRHGENTLGLVAGGGSSDTWSNRIGGSPDGTTIIAVVVLTSAGGNVLNSAAGATPPQTGVAVPVIRRL